MNLYTDTEYLEKINPYILGTATTCSYCDKINELILFEGKYTYITIAIGQFVEGYLQVCAKNHRTAATGLYDFETEELLTMKDIVRESYRRVYKTNGIAFEHGKAGACLWGANRQKNNVSLCHHCHIHFVPVEVDIRDLIKEYLPDELPISSIADLKKFRKEIIESEPYLYFEDSSLQGFAYPASDIKIPRQFLRSCVARKMGCEEKKDWVQYPGIEYYNPTRQKLEKEIKNIALTYF